MKLSIEEYLEEGADICPLCKSKNIKPKTPSFDCSGATIDVICKTCQCEWEETFETTAEKDYCSCEFNSLKYKDGEKEGVNCYQDVACKCGLNWINVYALQTFNITSDA